MTVSSSSPSSPPPRISDATHATVRLLAGAAFFSGAALRICDGLLPRLSRDFSISAGAAGRVVIAFSIAYSVMQLLFGPMGDRFGKARLVCAALLGCSALALVSSLSPDFDSLLAARVGWGMMAAGIIPLAMAWIGDAVPYEQRQPILAHLLMGTLSGMMAGQLIGGLFADSAWGWRGAFATMAAGYGFIGVMLAFRLRSIAKPVSAPVVPGRSGFSLFGQQLRSVLGAPWSWRVLGAALAEGVLLLGPMAFLPAYLHDRFGLSLAAASGLIALYAVGGLIYAVFARRIVQALGERRMVSAGGWLMGLGYLLWLVSPVVWTAGPVSVLVGFGTYLFHNTLQTHATQMSPTARGTSVSMFAFCLFFGQAIGVSAAGYAFDHLGAVPLLLGPALLLPVVGVAFARALRRRAAAGGLA